MAKLTQEQKDYKILLENVRTIAQSRQGKAFIWHLLEFCHVYDNSFTGNSKTFYNEGERAVGLMVLALLDDADPTLYARMLLERQQLKGFENDDDGTDTDDSDD